jgi:hypothetical protein
MESYCQDVLKRQQEFEQKVRKQFLLLAGIGVGLLFCCKGRNTYIVTLCLKEGKKEKREGV